MRPFRRKTEIEFLLLCIATLGMAVWVSIWLKTDQLYTHLFYLPIAWVATRLPRHTLTAGICFGVFHIGLEWFRQGSFPPVQILIRAGILVLVSLLLRRIWHKERRMHETFLQLDFQRFHDALTGVFNRQYFDACLKSDLRFPVAFFYCDINHLKQINDTLGHEAGDHQIRATAELLHRSIRMEDRLIRMGGDEFLILAQQCGRQEADMLHKRILDAMEQAWETAPDNPSAPPPVDFAIGHALAEKPEDMQPALARADRAMYAHKHPTDTQRAEPGYPKNA